MEELQAAATQPVNSPLTAAHVRGSLSYMLTFDVDQPNRSLVVFGKPLQRILHGRSRLTPVDLFNKWVEQNVIEIGKYDLIIREMKQREQIDFATLSVAAQELRKLIAD